MPQVLRKLHTLMSNTDPRGESFRYPDAMPEALGASQDDIDFVALREALTDGFSLSRGGLSMLDDAHQHLREMYDEYLADASDEQRSVEVEILTEEFEAAMRAEFEGYY